MRDRKKKKIFYKNYRNQFKLGSLALGFAGIFALLSLSLFYLSQMNFMTVKGYDVSALEKKKEQLVDERQRLEVEAARLQSIGDIQNDLSKTDMVPVKKVNYVSSASNVALK